MGLEAGILCITLHFTDCLFPFPWVLLIGCFFLPSWFGQVCLLGPHFLILPFPTLDPCFLISRGCWVFATSQAALRRGILTNNTSATKTNNKSTFSRQLMAELYLWILFSKEHGFKYFLVAHIKKKIQKVNFLKKVLSLYLTLKVSYKIGHHSHLGK